MLDDAIVAEHDEGTRAAAQDALQAVAQGGARGHEGQRGAHWVGAGQGGGPAPDEAGVGAAPAGLAVNRHLHSLRMTDIRCWCGIDPARKVGGYRPLMDGD
ncbi:hypothetical protein GCM10010170_079510 [Dactylosporangium salmoneum]|uniref:Uncharacterized protein n=1 Tax=Dactylosporangium salmoneum TaxID=53361 RepID=A0ABP5UF80_9ACTN